MENSVTPAEFFDDVVALNVDALGREVGELRLAVNAILSLDALAGIIHADLHERDLETADDIAFRDRLAAQHLEYGIVRDAAFALKHGELRGKKPRLVQRAEQVTSYSGAFDKAAFDRSAYDTKAVIWIEANDPTHSRRADHVTRAACDILRGMVPRTDG
jgi:hypothetical protein